MRGAGVPETQQGSSSSSSSLALEKQQMEVGGWGHRGGGRGNIHIRDGGEGAWQGGSGPVPPFALVKQSTARACVQESWGRGGWGWGVWGTRRARPPFLQDLGLREVTRAPPLRREAEGSWGREQRRCHIGPQAVGLSPLNGVVLPSRLGVRQV